MKMYPRDMQYMVLNASQFRIHTGIINTTSKFTMYVQQVGKQVYAPLCHEKYNINLIGKQRKHKFNSTNYAYFISLVRSCLFGNLLNVASAVGYYNPKVRKCIEL